MRDLISIDALEIVVLEFKRDLWSLGEFLELSLGLGVVHSRLLVGDFFDWDCGR